MHKKMIKTIVIHSLAGIRSGRQNPRDEAKGHSRLEKAFSELRQGQAKK